MKAIEMETIIEDATADLADGFRFYERQADGLGEYFLDALWSENSSHLILN